MSKIEKSKNHNGETIFPVTVADAVLMGNGQTLKGKLSELGSEVRYIKNEARKEEIASNESLTEMLLLQNGKEYPYSKSWCTGLIAYSNKNKYHYYGYIGNYDINPVAYYDNSGSIIGAMESSQGFVDTEIADIPKGTAYLRFCAIPDSKFEVQALSYYTTLKSEINEVRNELNVQLLKIQGLSKDVPGDELKYTDVYNILITSTSGHETPYDRATASDYINVVGGEKYYVSASMAFGYALCAFYDETKKFISAIASENNNTPTIIENLLVTVPENAKYIRVTQIYSNPLGRVNEIKTVPKVEDKWSNKKWVCVGDSLTEKNIRATKNYHDYIAERTGIDVVNFGMSGTGYKRTEENGTAFYQRVLSIPDDADVVTIFGSGNDLAHISVIGTATDSGTDTVGGCINTTINNILTKNPLVALGIISPTPWIGNSPSNPSNGMSKYSELLKEICRLRGIPFLDLFHCSNLRPDDEEFRKIAYSRDDGNGVHPDENGHKLIAPRFESFLGTLI